MLRSALYQLTKDELIRLVCSDRRLETRAKGAVLISISGIIKNIQAEQQQYNLSDQSEKRDYELCEASIKKWRRIQREIETEENKIPSTVPIPHITKKK